MGATATTFEALGTTVFLAVSDPASLPRARQLAEEVLTDVDQVCSRFRDDSDLTRVNEHPGRWVAVDPLLVAAVEVAVAAARATDGLVHPLLGRPLVELGYDRDFRLLTLLPRAGDPVELLDEPPGLSAWEEIGLDPLGAVRIPEGTALDLGATGKAWSADLIGAALEAHLDEPAVVSVGGDLRVANPGAVPWPVTVSEHPGTSAETTVAVGRGGLATSSTQVRRWTSAGVRRHHVLDPRTGLPAREVWRTVTAIGATCTAANTASTAAIVLGEQAPGWLAEHRVSARLVAADGDIRTVGDWPTERRAA